ncbi:MAG: S8 family serine peptidase [Proteobacteria bacterium]|nr:S8 family serine peptidase [Pseudomonadota bacterium]MBU4294413.1 S8 family serine peptidase [Pseudomonadota bacterium]MCG2747595.1 S8 family serine peptidase [Desulfobulbaceae bacterium]
MILKRIRLISSLLLSACLIASGAQPAGAGEKQSPGQLAAEMIGTGNTSSAAAQNKRYLIKLAPAPAAELARTPASLSQMLPDAVPGLIRQIPRFGLLAADLDAKGVQNLRNNPRVAFIEEDQLRYLSSQYEPYGINMVQADRLPDLHAGEVTVCIVDSGYDLLHEDLSGNNVDGVDIIGSGAWYEDTNKHGTHVAGTIAALNNQVGVVGVLPGGSINLYIARVFDSTGSAYVSDILAGMAECVSPGVGADVINMSFGSEESSASEETAFRDIANQGVLLVAAAGNSGTTAYSYPASYDSVISVAAIDQNKNRASFSQQNDQVELAAPGVNVLSTVPSGTVTTPFVLSQLIVDNTLYAALNMQGSPYAEVDGLLADCGIGAAPCPDAVGKICLIERGGSYFWQKVQACEDGGGIGAVIYNNVDGTFSGTLSDASTFIPSVSISRADGLVLLGAIGDEAHLSVGFYLDYQKMSGTSMATPHVTGVAALVWSYHHTTCSAAQVREALRMSAEDLGPAGYDISFGYGLVQAENAKLYLDDLCGGSSVARADLDGDGDVDGRDLALLAGFFATAASSADLNRDGVISDGDLQEFAAAFGTVPVE